MHDLLPTIDRWLERGDPVAVATVTATWGSAPRPVGAKLVVAPGGRFHGSVSGGCVEAAVIEAAGEVLATGQPRTLRFGVADETAWSIGLACGGQIAVFVAPLDPGAYGIVRERVLAGVPVAVVTVIDGPADRVGARLVADGHGVVDTNLPVTWLEPVGGLATLALADGRPVTTPVIVEPGVPLELFVDVVAPPRTLLMVGGVHIAMVLADLAPTTGWRTVVADPRAAFASPARFPRVDRLLLEWPEAAFAAEPLTPQVAVAVLTHDPKIDEPALALALPSPAFYVGVLGSRATQAQRRAHLRDRGVSAAAIARLRGPIGLDVGARTPAEIAVAILAEVIAVWNARQLGAPEAGR